jgi:hypothetical protein
MQQFIVDLQVFIDNLLINSIVLYRLFALDIIYRLVIEYFAKLSHVLLIICRLICPRIVDNVIAVNKQWDIENSERETNSCSSKKSIQGAGAKRCQLFNVNTLIICIHHGDCIRCYPTTN